MQIVSQGFIQIPLIDLDIFQERAELPNNLDISVFVGSQWNLFKF